MAIPPSRKLRFETLQVHAGQEPAPGTNVPRGAHLPDHLLHLRQRRARRRRSSRSSSSGTSTRGIMNPTTDVFEKRVAALEGGVAALATASGQAAQFLAITNIAQAGDNIVSSSRLYGGTYNQFKVTLPAPRHRREARRRRRGRRPRARPSTPKTKALYVETIGNPGFDIPDLAGAGQGSPTTHGIPLIVDNTFARRRLPVPPHRARRRHRGRVGHQVDRRPRHLHRRRHRRLGQVRLGAQRQVPLLHRALARLPRPGLQRRLRPQGPVRQHPVHHPRPRRGAARPGPGALARSTRSSSCRGSRPSRCACSATATTRSRWPAGWRSTRRSPGSATRASPSHPHHERAKKYLRNGFGAVLTFGIKGGARGRHEVHRRREAGQPPRQRGRRQDAGHPPGHHHPPAAHRGRAAAPPASRPT